MTMAQRGYRQLWWWWALMGLICVVALVGARGSAPTEGVSDERLFAIAAQLKCQQCTGESVADSQSPSAIQFREEIRRQMAQGASDDEILSYFSQPDRYDQQVLLTPPASGFGSIVWILPVVVFAGAIALLVATFRRWRRSDEDHELTDAERDRVAAALAEQPEFERARSDGSDDATEPEGGQG